MKLMADHYYFVYFCMFEEPAMFKRLSYSSELLLITNTRYQMYTIVMIRAHGNPFVLNVEGQGRWTVA